MSSRYASTYGAARQVSKIVSLIGWVLAGIGLGLIISTIRESGGVDRLFSGMDGVIAAAYLLISVAGLLLITLGQALRAILDTADNTGHMLFLIRGMVPQETQLISRKAEDVSKNDEAYY